MTTLAGSTAFGSGNGIGTSATFGFNWFSGIATDSGERIALVVSLRCLGVAITAPRQIPPVGMQPDRGNFLVRRIDLESRAVTTLAGGPLPGVADGFRTAATFVGPGGVAIDAAASFALVVSV